MPSSPPPCTPTRFAPTRCLPSCPWVWEEKLPFPGGLRVVLAVSSLFYMWYIISIGVSCWKELPNWISNQWSVLRVSPVLLVNKPTNLESIELHFYFCSYMFAGHTIVLYNWVGQLDTRHTRAVFVVFFSSKTSNLLICLHSLGYINSQIMHTALFLTLHFPLILKSNLSSECPGDSGGEKKTFQKEKEVPGQFYFLSSYACKKPMAIKTM